MVSRLLDQLRAPLTMSMFRNAEDLAAELLRQREEVADEITILDFERTALRAERDELLQALKALMHFEIAHVGPNAGQASIAAREAIAKVEGK